ncbi:hypothetical protein MROS_0119 [Melioribacter roseus P3M-2]|uniref:Uncharacterized protein n=1 Tax=Melioribacter roseus (strain DSM 23840 / JCM 17771 / VKM B-2668 / P3M-2) TaxID=1191523 RepID=I6ZWC0_MELRP|nr:VLRF1 family aeRF1-type release factor [Melioribacter roseus]AFN73363.1 hypothetical protein MROS_0119 [Melioribacter roseus P3M-2]
MLQIESRLNELREWIETADADILTIYADVNPANPENAGRSWLKRIKNALQELPEIRDSQGKRDEPLYDLVMELLEQEKPEARTLALFAYRDKNKKLRAERLDLQIDLPIVNLANGRVDVRYGDPYLTPLLFAVDEYERTGILIMKPDGWKFYEVFLGEAREVEEIFGDTPGEDWNLIAKSNERISTEMNYRAANPGGRFDKLSPKDRASARTDAWLNKYYNKLARALSRTVDSLPIERLALVGEKWQTSHFETYLTRRLQNRIVARIPLWPDSGKLSPNTVWRRVELALIEAERKNEMELLDKLNGNEGLRGIDKVLDALQMGRVQVWILPWSLDINIWRCSEGGFIAASREIAETVCSQPEEVPLREYVLRLAAEYGSDLEFVRGKAEERLLKEMGGMAALPRW